MHTKESLAPFVSRVINNSIKYKKYTRLANGILIYINESNGINEELYTSLLNQAPFFVYNHKGWKITLFPSINNKGLYICVAKSVN